MARVFKITKMIIFLVLILLLGYFTYTNFFRVKTIAIVYHDDDSININSYVKKLYRRNTDFDLIDLGEDSLDISIEHLDNIDGVVFTGGKDFDPAIYGGGDSSLAENYNFKQDRADITFLGEALERNLPVLGICRGFQLINIYFGGTLYEDLPTQFSKKISHKNGKHKFSSHQIELEPATRLYNLVKEDSWTVNSFHHQGIKDLGDGLIVSAKAPDGLVEAFENPSYKYLVGVQWHPEAMNDDYFSERIFDDFLKSIR